MGEVTIENGFVRAGAGDWLVSPSQPAAFRGACRKRSLRGFVVPDRLAVRELHAEAEIHCAASSRPFLTRLDALPDETLSVVSSKLLLAPSESRISARSLKLIPMSFRRATPVTEFRSGWVVLATKSRVTRVSLEDGETLTVRPEALAAWFGKAPTGFCPRLSVLDLLLPKGPSELAFSFHGPCIVWFEGAEECLRKTPVRWQ